MSNAIYIPKQDYKVLVRCFTYNQSKYIEDALNGFAMQQTNFPFVCLVMDDCSTDGEQDVIKAWMERECDVEKAEYIDLDLSNVILVPHKTNESCTFAFYLLKQNLWKQGNKKSTLVKPWREHCKYEAPCEGDDYWSDIKKLQKQANYLDTNADCCLCYGKCRFYFEARNEYSNNTYGGPYETFDQLMKENTIHTPTVMYRIVMNEQYMKEIHPEDKGWKMGDYPKWLYFAHCGKIHFFDYELAVYRYMQESSSHSQDEAKSENFVHRTMDVRRFYATLYNRADLFSDNDLYIALFSHSLRIGQREKALAYYKKINQPSFKLRIKRFLLSNELLYTFAKNRLFITINR